jgi:peptide deformylase
MILEIVKFGTPVLRQRGVKINSITPEIKQLAADMLETMKTAHGVGLAAQQVGHALQMAVVDVRGVEDRPSTLEIDGKPADVDSHMPVVLINPELKPEGDKVVGPEGCLSFPEIFTDVARPGAVLVRATNADGRTFEFRCTGLLSRAIQHEVDHLNGILFIDRMGRVEKDEVQDQLDELQVETKEALKKKAKKA